MSQFSTFSSMFESIKSLFSSPFKATAIFASAVVIVGCSTAAQQQADAQIAALNKQEAKSPEAQTQPYLGGYGPSDPPRLSTDAPYDPLNPELSETVGVPFLSFLIIEPDPVTKNAVPSDIEKLVKARRYQDAIDAINDRLKKTPRNVQLRYIKARLQLELRDFDGAKKTLIEITQQFPELPEPYNNLAAIAANQGRWIEARDYLELALKLRPSYSLAAANLGEVYVRLGAKAYEDAAANTQLNQRLYTNRAKFLLNLLKPQAKGVNNTVNPASNSSTNTLEGKSSNGEGTPKNQ
ncbi:tetratricopeptide repeat protein [Polynucleobacter sp. MWH-UH19D]|uniref:tetratricopeptide repeat protein n=1 Tax=Polynucleobacter sp. MWH-UH19D TaxID=1855610 RepID=UPI003364E771